MIDTDGDGRDDEDPPMADEEMQNNLIWLENICKYTNNPVLLQDINKSLAGAWAHNVKDLEKQKIFLAKNDAKLVIQNEVEKVSVDGRGSFKVIE